MASTGASEELQTRRARDRRTRFLRELVRPALGATLVWFLALEILARLALLAWPHLAEPLDVRRLSDSYPDTAAWVDDYYEEWRESNVARWEPYVYWRRQPYEGAYINVDERGLRMSWQDTVRSENAILVYVFGGSTVWGTGARDFETIPSQLARLMSQETNRPARVVNFGESGYVSTQEMIAFQQELARGRVPDVAVFYDGVNDVFAAFQEGEAGLPKNESHRRAEFNLANVHAGRTASVVMLALHHLMTDLALVRLGERLYNAAIDDEGRRDRWADRLDEGSTKRLAEMIVRHYVATIGQIQAVAEERGVRTLFYWQPMIFTKKHLTAFEQRQADELEYVRPLYLAVQKSVERSEPLTSHRSFANLSRIFDEDAGPIYIDYSHVSEQANERIARRIRDDILKPGAGITPRSESADAKLVANPGS